MRKTALEPEFEMQLQCFRLVSDTFAATTQLTCTSFKSFNLSVDIEHQIVQSIAMIATLNRRILKKFQFEMTFWPLMIITLSSLR